MLISSRELGGEESRGREQGNGLLKREGKKEEAVLYNKKSKYYSNTDFSVRFSLWLQMFKVG